MNIRMLVTLSLALGISACAADLPVKDSADKTTPPNATTAKLPTVATLPEVVSAPAPQTKPASATAENISEFMVPDENTKTDDNKSGATNSGHSDSDASRSAHDQSYDSPQAIADALAADAKLEVSEWAQETLSTRFCKGDIADYFWQTCHTIGIYMEQRYKSAGMNDARLLQDALRSDLRNYETMVVLKTKKGDWHVAFVASFIDTSQRYGLTQALRWIKDVPYIRSMCGDSPSNSEKGLCELREKSIFIDAYLSAMQRTKDSTSPDCTAFMQVMAENSKHTPLDCSNVAHDFHTWLRDADPVAAAALALLDDATALDRSFRSTKSTGSAMSFGSDGYFNRYRIFLERFSAFNDFVNESNKEELQRIFTIYAAAAANNYRQVTYELISDGNKCKDFGDWFTVHSNTPCELLLLASDIANADGISDLSNTINNVASPSNGYKYKTVAPWLLSLTGLVGVDYERDHLTGPSVNTTTWAKGGFIPVGLEISTPCFGSACGLLFSIIDVGNLINYSNSKDTGTAKVDNSPNTNFSQVRSLGLYLVWTFHNSPFAVGFGWSRTPELRIATLSGPNASTEKLDASRFMVFLAVDVTLAPLKEEWP